MESKLIAVEITKEHPKLMRLPSVSRSLYFSIMPKSCYDMYEKPVILKLQKASAKTSNPPVFSTYRSKRTRSVKTYEARPMVKPCANSYVYNKMFNPKPPSEPPKLPKRATSRPNTTPVNPLVTFYCEINPPKSAPKRTARPKNLNSTLFELGEVGNSMRKSPSRNLLGYQPGLMVDKEMEIDISADFEEDLDKISEVHSSLELSVESHDMQRARTMGFRK